MQIGFVHRKMKNASAYEARYYGVTNKTTDAAAECVDKEREMIELTKRVERAVSRLSKKEQEIIQKRYLEEEAFDYIVAGEVGLSE